MTNSDYKLMTTTQLEDELHYLKEDATYFENRVLEVSQDIDWITGELNSRAARKRAKSSRKAATTRRNRATKRTR